MLISGWTTTGVDGSLPRASVRINVQVPGRTVGDSPIGSPITMTVCQIATSTPWSGLRKERRQEGWILTRVKTCANMPLEGLRQDLCRTLLGAEVLIRQTISEAGALQDAMDIMIARETANAVTNIGAAESGGARRVARDCDNTKDGLWCLRLFF